ncbi:hypothetical protein SYNTR_0984 [Candidatus Syntrophocurvum alkaliphilum]|uniref:Amidohydrolase-related domain-containing protein n=1 Tax=Candidatus Syntrophocurvum alkaliphilum TaxID=2293317 RepID=A0A6I6DEJ3_9FIRM|nr:amidohydrolase family protein [Candidatus Syntrophocurvum alkaliphilum]QGT99577.1 hypothetical protein SYNTR_0984 [Candidatus Syntrophocurvum alkaliphilum]
MNIIDVHCHLGDILYNDGGKLIYETGVKLPVEFDPQNINEKNHMQEIGMNSIPYTVFGYWSTKAQRARNFTATLENYRLSLKNTDIIYTVCMPIEPNVTIEDLYNASKFDDRILFFTSVDFDNINDLKKKFQHDINIGALGLKLHPIIQKIALNNERVFDVIELFSYWKKPILVHAGIAYYYLKNEQHKNIPDYGKINYLNVLVRTFPHINFIIGHAGLSQIDEVCKQLKDCKNIWLDTSFQPPANINKLIKIFGAEKIMFASDWPFTNRIPSIKTVKYACEGDKILEEMIFYKNATNLLDIKTKVNCK